jgi:hypothetical protein
MDAAIRVISKPGLPVLTWERTHRCALPRHPAGANRALDGGRVAAHDALEWLNRWDSAGSPSLQPIDWNKRVAFPLRRFRAPPAILI